MGQTRTGDKTNVYKFSGKETRKTGKAGVYPKRKKPIASTAEKKEKQRHGVVRLMNIELKE